MRKCKRNILLIFGYLLIVAILFVPYSFKKYDMGQGAATIVRENGFMFLPFVFIKDKIINIELLFTEIAGILFVGGFAYILFCVVLRKEKGREND